MPLSIGLILLVFMAVVIYWFLTTVLRRETSVNDNIYPDNRTFNFEAAPEFMSYPANEIEFNQSENNIKLIKVQDSWIACWTAQEELFNKLDPKEGIDNHLNDLALRIYESSDQLRHHDLPINKLQGSCKLYLRSHNAYYVSLGIKKGQKFHPLLVSNTIIPNELQ